MKAAKPENEAERLAALREYHILDTDAEQEYDDITILAANICNVPMAMISLVDDSRQWFKAKVGLEQRETAREAAFCAHTILHSEPMIVRDATKDRRFADNAMVKRAPFIRFYAGYPLISPGGYVLGTLCAVDRKPHHPSPERSELMQALARQVMALLELRRVSSHLADALEKLKTLHGLLPICAWCKRIRDGEGYWSQVESYIMAHSDADFTHGICPECKSKVEAAMIASAGNGKHAHFAARRIRRH